MRGEQRSGLGGLREGREPQQEEEGNRGPLRGGSVISVKGKEDTPVKERRPQRRPQRRPRSLIHSATVTVCSSCCMHTGLSRSRVQPRARRARPLLLGSPHARARLGAAGVGKAMEEEAHTHTAQCPCRGPVRTAGQRTSRTLRRTRRKSLSEEVTF